MARKRSLAAPHIVALAKGSRAPYYATLSSMRKGPGACCCWRTSVLKASCPGRPQKPAPSLAATPISMGILPSPSCAARRSPAAVRPPTQIDGCGFCTGRDSKPASAIW